MDATEYSGLSIQFVPLRQDGCHRQTHASERYKRVPPIVTLMALSIALVSGPLLAQTPTITDVPLVLKARTVARSVKVEWNKNNRFASQPEFDKAFIASAALSKHYVEVPAKRADLLVVIDDDVFSDTVTLSVLNPETNLSVYEESRPRVDIENDVQRLVAHFLAAVADAREEDAEAKEAAKEKAAADVKAAQEAAELAAEARQKTDESEAFSKRLHEGAASLPLDWAYPCPADKPTCEPETGKVWIDQDTLHETAIYPVDSKAGIQIAADCSLHDNLRESPGEWAGTCVYTITWTNTVPNVVCKAETSEEITYLTASRIEGLSGHVDWSPLKQTPPRCPVAGSTKGAFSITPKSTGTLEEAR